MFAQAIHALTRYLHDDRLVDPRVDITTRRDLSHEVVVTTSSGQRVILSQETQFKKNTSPQFQLDSEVMKSKKVVHEIPKSRFRPQLPLNVAPAISSAGMD